MDRLGRRAEDAVALLALALGAFLRFDGLGTPSYWLDEILHQNIDAASRPWWQWLTGFERENGPLYYLLQLTGSEWVGRLLPALFGIAAIALVASVSRIAALLLAVSPLAVYYSREARPYALLMLLTAALIVLLLRGKTFAACAVIVAILYSCAMGAPVVAGALAVALLLRSWWVAGTAAGALALFPLLYRTTTNVTTGPPFPALGLPFAMTVLRNLSVTALGGEVAGRAAVGMFALAVLGAVVLARRERRTAIVIAGMTLVPLVVTLAALWKFGHWYGARYIAPVVVGYVVLAGFGIAAVARALTRRFAAPSPAKREREAEAQAWLAVAIALVFAWQAWPAVRTEPWRKLDWRAIADKIAHYAHAGDLVIAGEPWSEAALRYYLRGRVRLEGIPYPSVAEALTYSQPGVWLATGGYGSNATRTWMCRYQIVLASALEDFRLHYAGDFLRERGGPPEWRAFEAATGENFVIDLAAAENRFLDPGWAMPEGFRWAVGTRSSVTFPRWSTRDRAIRLRVMPMENAALPPQTVRVSLNGQPIGELTLTSGWQERELRTPAAAWRNGLNTLAFDFGRAAAPADLDPKASDHRPLAAAFEWISVGAPAPGRAALPRAAAPTLRIASAPFIDEQSAWRHTRTRFGPAPAAMAGRLGFDPEAAGRVHLENLVESVAYGSDCEDDHAFLQRAFTTILARPPDQYEERELAKLPRIKVPVRLTKSEEFRRAVLAAAPDRASAPGTRSPGRRTP